MKIYRYIISLLTITTILVACASPVDVSMPTMTNIPPTESPIPSTATPIPPTVTPKPLTQRDIEPLLIQSGDLPSGYEPGQVFDQAPEMFSNLPAPDLAIDQRFQKNGETKGGVTILIYEEQWKIDSTYGILQKGLDSNNDSEATKSVSHEIKDIGEKAFYSYLHAEILSSVMDSQDLIFTRCTAVIYIRITDSMEEREIVAYAKRLDQRLKDLVCK